MCNLDANLGANARASAVGSNAGADVGKLRLPSARHAYDEQHDAFRSTKKGRSPCGDRPRAREEEEMG
jgi:hypothetical protein